MINLLKLTEENFNKLKKDKRCTIRAGYRDVRLGNLRFESDSCACIVKVINVIHTTLSDVPEKYMINDGFGTHNEMIHGLRLYYPDIDYNSEVTIINWR